MTGRHLKIRPMGEAALGVVLEGNPQKPEPIYFRVKFPGGEVDIVRTDGDYWVHVITDHEHDTPKSRICDARLDINGKHAAETDPGDFNNPELYHLAVRVTRKERAKC